MIFLPIAKVQLQHWPTGKEDQDAMTGNKWQVKSVRLAINFTGPVHTDDDLRHPSDPVAVLWPQTYEPLTRPAFHLQTQSHKSPPVARGSLWRQKNDWNVRPIELIANGSSLFVY